MLDNEESNHKKQKAENGDNDDESNDVDGGK